MKTKSSRNSFKRALKQAMYAVFPVDRRNVNCSRGRTMKCERLESRQLCAADAFFGIYQQGTWTLSDTPALKVSFGLAGDQPVMGDWNGDGRETAGIFRNGTWVLDLNGNGFDSSDRVLKFGLPGDKAVAGDWDGDGVDTVGVFRDGAWFMDRNGNGYDAADVDPVFFGWGSDTPVPGDWNGDGKDSPGVFRAGTWALDITGNGFDAGDRFLQFGLPGDQPISGDWNRDRTDTPAVLQKNRWYFDLEGDGYTGEKGIANLFGNGIAVAGGSSIGPRPAPPPGMTTHPAVLGGMRPSSGGVKDNILQNSGSGGSSQNSGSGGFSQSSDQSASPHQGGGAGTESQPNNGNTKPSQSPSQGGNAVKPSTSNFGTVVSSQSYDGTFGIMIIKSVRTFGANGNNLRLYADFLTRSGASIRTDVLIGNPNSSFGDQCTPQVTALDQGRYAIAWRSTSLSNRTDIHYSIMDAYGSPVGVSDRIANIGYATNLELRNVSKVGNGFQISWLDKSSNRIVRRDFNMTGTATTGSY